jgi:hypothetical protein
MLFLYEHINVAHHTINIHGELEELQPTHCMLRVGAEKDLQLSDKLGLKALTDPYYSFL